MKAEYDLTNARPNPYIEKLRRPVTMNLDTFAIDYFKREADRTGIPYQRLINLYLVQCAREEKHLPVGHEDEAAGVCDFFKPVRVVDLPLLRRQGPRCPENRRGNGKDGLFHGLLRGILSFSPLYHAAAPMKRVFSQFWFDLSKFPFDWYMEETDTLWYNKTANQ